MIYIFAAIVTSFLITFMAIPTILKVAKIKHLFDYPDLRKKHTTAIPTLGGLGIFAGFIVSITFWINPLNLPDMQYYICAFLIIFFVGLKDDIVNLIHWKKLLAQLLIAFILVHFSNVQLNSLNGFFGIFQLDTPITYLLSIFTIVVITNSFNLIDGIDMLAGSTGILASSILGAWFFMAGHLEFSVIAASLTGGLIAFLCYNKSPAKIFMGDTGSLLIGLILSILTIKFISLNRELADDHLAKLPRSSVLAISVLIVPLFDTMRVFIIRIMKGKSPLAPDSNHLHHYLVELGLSHLQTTMILIVMNIVFIAVTYSLKTLKIELIMLVILAMCIAISVCLSWAQKKKDTNGKLHFFITTKL